MVTRSPPVSVSDPFPPRDQSVARTCPKTLDQGVKRCDGHAAQPSKLHRLKLAGADEFVHECSPTPKSLRDLAYGEQKCARPNAAFVRKAEGRQWLQANVGVLSRGRFIEEQL